MKHVFKSHSTIDCYECGDHTHTSIEITDDNFKTIETYELFDGIRAKNTSCYVKYEPAKEQKQ